MAHDVVATRIEVDVSKYLFKPLRLPASAASGDLERLVSSSELIRGRDTPGRRLTDYKRY